jgi:iron(III) transport system permease protein
MTATTASVVMTGPVKQRAHWTDHIASAAIAVVALGLLAFLAAPLAAILLQSLENARTAASSAWPTSCPTRSTPALLQSLWNSVWVSALVTVVTVPLAFVFAYALARSCMPAKPLVPHASRWCRCWRRRCFRRSR